MYIGQEKVFTYANKVLPYNMKQQVLDAIADGTPAIRELFSTSTRELYTLIASGYDRFTANRTLLS